MHEDLEELAGLLQLEKRRFAALAEHSRDGIIVLDSDAQVVTINPTALHHLDLVDHPDNWIGHPFLDVVREVRDRIPEVATQTLGELRRVLYGDVQPSEGEYRIGPRSIHWLSLPVQISGLQVGQLVILSDVTEARQLKALRADLTQLMVNDLKGPLGDLATSLQTLDRAIGGQVQQDQRQVLQHSVDCVQDLLSSITVFIEISALESGRMPLSPSAFSFPELVDHVLEIEQPLAERRQLQLERHMSHSLPLTWGDRNLILRVLQNLVSNAVRFTPPGGKVDIEAGPKPRDIDKIQVSVTDTGCGIPYALTDRLFEKFAAGGHESAGSGLGLAFCRLVLEAHGERIWISRSSTAGTTITFTLPQLADPLSSIYPVQ